MHPLLRTPVVSVLKPLLRVPSRRSSEEPAPPTEAPTCRYKYQPEIEVMINMQIQAEHQAAHDYLGMAVHFAHACVARPGCRGFFMLMYEEEVGHALQLAEYQLTRGGVVQLGALSAPPAPPAPPARLGVLDAFRRALAMEHAITEKLENIVIAAEGVKDYQCADYITSAFLQEQMSSIRELSAHVTRLAQLESCHALYHYDLQLLVQYPYTIKCKRK